MQESNASRLMFGAGVIAVIGIVAFVLKDHWPAIKEGIMNTVGQRGVFQR